MQFPLNRVLLAEERSQKIKGKFCTTRGSQRPVITQMLIGFPPHNCLLMAALVGCMKVAERYVMHHVDRHTDRSLSSLIQLPSLLTCSANPGIQCSVHLPAFHSPLLWSCRSPWCQMGSQMTSWSFSPDANLHFLTLATLHPPFPRMCASLLLPPSPVKGLQFLALVVAIFQFSSLL